MKKLLSGLALSIIASGAMAQETYESAQLATQDLNGTARYVGMGGAMEALGADISTITTNPAGIGLFRKSWAGISAGISIQNAVCGNDVTKFGATFKDNSKTNVDFNQIGVVFSKQSGNNSWFNLSFNYSKNRNFNQITNAINSLNDASANKMSYLRLASTQMSKDDQTAWGNTRANAHPKDARWLSMSMIDDLTFSTVNDHYTGWSSDRSYWSDGYIAGTAYCGQNEASGYISNFDFNASGNINNRIFLGITFGLKDVRYKCRTAYDETLTSELPTLGYQAGSYGYTDDRRITGTGFDVKFGVIVRPIENSGFRIGAYVHTPTWYELNCDINMSAASTLPSESVASDGTRSVVDSLYGASNGYSYKYKIVTPWKFGFSLGHTIDNIVALGATYEYADYSTIKNKINDGTVTSGEYYSDWYGDYGYYTTYDTYARDDQMDANTKSTLKGVHTLKLGAEVKPVPEVAIRIGYNWVSPMYKTSGSKDYTIYANPDYASSGSYYTTYSYTNWKDTHRITFGLGFKLSEKINLDLSYQYSTQKGEYHPFQDIASVDTYTINADGSQLKTSFSPESINGNPTSVKNNRHQVNCTLGIKL